MQRKSHSTEPPALPRWGLLMRLALFLAAAGCFLGGPAVSNWVDPAPDVRWWRGNLHTHTLWSDGDDFPEMVVEWYREHGYQFLALSDHNVLSQGEKWMSLKSVADRAKADAYGKYLRRFGPQWVETRNSGPQGDPEVRLKPFDEYRPFVEERGQFIMLQAEEITHAALNGRAFNMNATNLGEVLQPLDGATVREAIANNLRAVEESAARTGRQVLVHVNHPNYKWGVTAEDLAAVVNERFFEVWNGVENDNDPGDGVRPSTDEIWDIANALRIAGMSAPPLFGVATDDSHNYHGNNTRAMPGRGWVMVRAQYLTPESIIRAMRAGDFYATTGVVLDAVAFNKQSRTLSLQIHPQGNETFVTRFVGTRKGVNLKGRPRVDRSGRVVDTTLDYRTASGPQIGEVLAELRGTTPAYTLRGDELYVRAIVTSSGAPDVLSSEFGFKRAWTQPVGW